MGEDLFDAQKYFKKLFVVSRNINESGENYVN